MANKKTDCVRCGALRAYGHTKSNLGYLCLSCFQAWNRGEWHTSELSGGCPHCKTGRLEYLNTIGATETHQCEKCGFVFFKGVDY